MRFPRGGLKHAGREDRQALMLLDGGNVLHLRLLSPGEGTAGLFEIILEVFPKIIGNRVSSAQPARVGGSLITSEGRVRQRQKLQAQLSLRDPSTSPSPDSRDLFPPPHPVPALQLELVNVLARSAAGYSHPRSVRSFLCCPSLGAPGLWGTPGCVWAHGWHSPWGAGQAGAVPRLPQRGSSSTPMSPLLTAGSP